MSEMSPGTLFAGHRIEGVAGRGGMGVVYRAVQLALNRPVALKVIAPALVADDSARERFVRESTLAAGLDHPNVIPIYGAGDEHGIAYIAMRYVTGVNLHELVEVERRLDPRRAVRIVVQVAAALEAAHASGLVHRDVKPANILLTDDDHAYLCDFGLSKRTVATVGLTGAGRWVGTPDFAAPEQIRGEQTGPPVDIYALGGVLYFALTGSVPFPREDDDARLWAQLVMPAPRPSVVADVPTALDAVVERALAKHPLERYASASALATAANAAWTGPEDTAPAPTMTAQAAATSSGPAATRRRSRALVLAGLALFAVIGAAALAILTDGGPPEREPTPTAAPARLGRLKITNTEPGARLGEFARRKRRLGQEIRGLSPASESLVGTIVTFEVTAVGFHGQTLTLRWSLFDARTSTQLDSRLQSRLRIEAARDRVADLTWVQDPERSRQAYITLELYDPRRTQLATARTPTFRVGEG
jgi:predicted Ser/Thr protein kinase